ncbi:trigger factor [Ferrigenium kumadai]|uniref:Trigger factor n=1 Tax=Ferrigenium kumadai TaxID=1682490 RepID=A0AAN1SYX9_9PROT|nr:trigger factor [Ferrigenium kumadai]BBI99658.1 trigger factor [Ferrigenium kumadai]
MSSVETVSALERRLNASIPQQAIRSQVANRLKHIGRTAKLAGFRPGKIPAKVLEQHYGAQAHQEALGEALQQSFAEAAQANNLKVAGYPQFEIKTNDLNAEQIEYSATFEVYPEVVMGDVGGETIERAVYELGQSDVDNTIATLRKQRATFEKVDRAAQAEDQVRIDFTGKLNGEVFQGGEAKDYPFQLGMGRMLPEFEAAITGMKAGETKSFDMTFPENYHGKDVAGKQVTFTITLNSVEAPKLPEVDAEFVKSLGVADGDVAKLEEEIRSNLSREVSRRLKGRNKDAAMDALLKVAQFDLPKSLVEWEVQNLMQQTVKDMEARGMKMKGMPLPPELFKERAEKRVKLGLILADLVQKHDLKAKPEQVRALIDDHAQSYDQPEEVVHWYYSNPAHLQEIENLVLEDNVVSWTLGQAKTTDKAVAFNELMGN